MNIRAALAAAHAMPCHRQRLEQVTGLCPVSCKRLVIQMRGELGMRIKWSRATGYVVKDWGYLRPDVKCKNIGLDM